jgi:hypothetical protein
VPSITFERSEPFAAIVEVVGGEDLDGAEGQNRTGDTVIFSHVLYQLSYLGTPGRGTPEYPEMISRRFRPTGESGRMDRGRWTSDGMVPWTLDSGRSQI